MMPSDDDDVHNPPRRGTRSWSTPDPVSRGRRYSYSCRKNEKGVFNKSQSFSPRKRDKRERERKERRIASRERENRHHPIHSAFVCVVIAQSSKSLTEEFDYNREEKRTKETLQRELLLLLLLTWLGQFTTRKDDDKALLLLGPRVVIFKVFAY